jgi:hypothetical protein
MAYSKTLKLFFYTKYRQIEFPKLCTAYYVNRIHNTVTDTPFLNVLEFAVLGPLRHLVDLALLVPNVEDGELLLVAVLSYTQRRGLKSTFHIVN